jgi:opacity protein-like surface antigen
MKGIATTFLLLAFCLLAGAQELSYGFKAGLNFSTLSGDLEQDDAGATVEEFNRATSFHVGVGFSYNFTDHFGARAELMYTQKGVRFRYDGTSFTTLTSTTGNAIIGNGTRMTTNNVLNSYIDLPLMFFARPFEWLEVSVGPSIGVLVSATGAGSTTFSGQTASGTTIPEHSLTLEYNYIGDETGEADPNNGSTIKVGSQNVDLPGKIGAYYDIPRVDGNFFNVLDLGINAGLSFYLSETLYLAGRLNYGFSDVTNNDYDFSQVKLDADNMRIPRSDFDRNVSIQASVGFNL